MKTLITILTLLVTLLGVISEDGNEVNIEERDLLVDGNSYHRQIRSNKSKKPGKSGKPSKKPGKPSKKPGKPSKKPGKPSKKPGKPSKKPAKLSKKPGKPSKKPGKPNKKPGKPGKPNKKPGKHIKKPIKPSKKPEKPNKKPDKKPGNPENPPTFNINWKLHMTEITTCVEPGYVVSFNWNNFGHNVNKMKEKDWINCRNFNNTDYTQGPYTYHTKEIGTFYFACGVANHCAQGGMKATISVANKCQNSPIAELIGNQENQGIQDKIVIRMNVSSINQGMPIISEYNEALKTIKDWSGPQNYTNIGSYHGAPYMCNKDQNGTGTVAGCCIPHWGGPTQLFTPWHRLVMYQMEQSLRNASNNNLAFPYWDWTVAPSDGHELPYLVRQGEWLKGPIKEPEKGADGSHYTSRNPTPLRYTELENQVQTAFCAKNFKEFNSQIQFPHNAVHVLIGGDMPSTLTASYDPIFYLHHSYVDLQYVYYQELQKLRNLPISFGKYENQKMYPFAESDNPYKVSFYHSEGPQGLDYMNVFKYEFEQIIFKGMKPKDFYNNENELCKSEKIFAGLFLKQTGITSAVQFDIIHNNVSTYGGSLHTFSSRYKNPDFSATAKPPVKLYDVTQSVDIKDNNLKFVVSKYTDALGNDLPISETFQPIIVYQEPNSESYIFRLHVEQVHEYAPVMYGRIGHHVEFLKNGEVVTGDDDVRTWIGGTDDDSEDGKPVEGRVAIEYQEHGFIVNNEHGQTNFKIGYDFDCFECNAANFPVSACPDIKIIPWNLDWLQKIPIVNITNCYGTNTIIASCDHTLSTVKMVDKDDYDDCSNLWTKGTGGIYGLLVDTSIPGTYYFADGQKTGTSNQNYCDLGWKITVNVEVCDQN